MITKYWEKINTEWDSHLASFGINEHVSNGYNYKDIRVCTEFYIPPLYWHIECCLKNTKNIDDPSMWYAIHTNLKDFQWIDKFRVTRRHSYKIDGIKCAADYFRSKNTIEAINLRTGKRYIINRESIFLLWIIL